MSKVEMLHWHRRLSADNLIAHVRRTHTRGPPQRGDQRQPKHARVPDCTRRRRTLASNLRRCPCLTCTPSSSTLSHTSCAQRMWHVYVHTRFARARARSAEGRSHARRTNERVCYVLRLRRQCIKYAFLCSHTQTCMYCAGSVFVYRAQSVSGKERASLHIWRELLT